MAKKSSAPNKSQTIRDYVAANPTAKPKAIAEALSKKGLDVNAQYVSTILSNDRKSKTKRRAKTGRPAGSSAKSATRAVKTAKRGRPAAKATSESVSVDSLLKLKDVVDEIGGIEEAKSHLKALESLSS